MTAMRALSPWAWRESLRLLVLVLIGLVLLSWSWNGAAGEARLGHQITWLNVATFGWGVAGFGVASWVLRSRAIVRARRAALLERAVPASRATETADLVVAGRHQGRFHRADCPLVTGRPWKPQPRSTFADRDPCGVCRP